MNQVRNLSKKGFTLIELVIVIAILGVLVAIAIMAFTNVTARSRETADTYSAKKIERAIFTYRFESNDMNLSQITHTTASELVGNFQKLITIPSNTEGDIAGKYGPYLESNVTIKPQNVEYSGWTININLSSNIITVKPGDNSCTVTP